MLTKIFQKLKFFWLSLISLLIGMRVTMKNFFARSVTLEYPLKKQPMTANFRGMVDLKPEACVICYQCIKICPVAALDLAHKQIVAEDKKKNEITRFTYNAELCCFCGLCDEICPTDAIFMNKMYEVSAYSHDQIVNIDLMGVNKYDHLDPHYNFATEVKLNDDNTVGVIKKPAVAAALAPAGGPTPAAGPSPTIKPAETPPKPTTTDQQPS